MKNWLLGLAGILAFSAVRADSATDTAPPKAPTVSVSSPNHVLSVEVTEADGFPVYRVLRFGKPVIGYSHLGFVLKDAGKLAYQLHVVAPTEAPHHVDETWEQPWGERRYIRNHYSEQSVRLTEPKGLKRALEVIVRVYDDGIGFRYAFPDQPQLHDVVIADELTEFNIVDPATAWWMPWGESHDTELVYQRTALSELSTSHTPLTLRTKDHVHIEIHEAALVDFAGFYVQRVDEQHLRAHLVPASEGWAARRTAPFKTPWRMIAITDSAGALYESNLELNLNDPNVLGDVSWIQPGKFLGIWWEMFHEDWTWASGPKHGATTEHAKRYIDFAAKHHFRGLLIEGWNVGWDSEWAGDGSSFSFTEAYPDFDLPTIAAYARAKGVHIIGHHETGGDTSNYEAQMGSAFDLYQSLGIDAVKTGYVADADQIHHKDLLGAKRTEWHDSQYMANHYLTVVKEAAKRHIMIDSHEPIKDTGLRRTYPNWLAREGSRGQEYNAFGVPVNPPEHETNLVFTRMLGGPMDFTPGVFDLKHIRPCCSVPTTLMKQLALYVVLYSPVTMAADRIQAYEARPDAFKFIEDVPTDWSETHVINAEVGDYVTIVRKDRHTDNWYLGSITDENGRLLPISLGFLEQGRHYRAEIYRDGANAHWDQNPYDYVIESRDVTSTETLELRLAPGGGEAIRFVAEPIAKHH
jgi:alpha-glucosidase